MVKCQHCGYLAMRVTMNGVSQGLVEVDEQTRSNGQVPYSRAPYNQIGGLVPNLGRFPIYFARIFDIVGEMTSFQQQQSRHVDDEEAILEVIAKDRCCDGWVKWDPGFSPKEHREMLNQHKLQEREVEWQMFQERMAEDERRWREEQEVKSEQRHQREMQTIKQINKTQMWIMGGLVTLAIVIATLLGRAIGAGWVPKWFGIGQTQTTQTTPVSADSPTP